MIGIKEGDVLLLLYSKIILKQLKMNITQLMANIGMVI